MGTQADFTMVSTLLEQIFLYYATTTPKGTLLTLTSFQKLALDSDMIDSGQTSATDETLTSAQVDLIFKRVLANGNKGKASHGQRYMTLQQFMDAIVLLATTKYAGNSQGIGDNPRTAVQDLYQAHFATFQTEDTNVSNEWLRAMEWLAMPLFYIFKHYFPLELNPHYKLTAAESRDNVQMAFQRIMEDYEIAPKLFDKKPIVFEALRKAYKNPIPRKIKEAIDLEKLGHFGGQHFTFHHFLVAMQTCANCMRKYERKNLANDQPDEEDQEKGDKKTLFSARAVQSLEMLLKRMDLNKRSQAPQVKLMSDEHAKEVEDLAYTSKNPDANKELDTRASAVNKIILQVYNFYVTLGEPLAQALSIRKFNRFLRDISIVPCKGTRKNPGMSDGNGIVQRIQNHQPTPQFSTSQTPLKSGGHDVDSPRMGQMLSSSPGKIGSGRKVPLDSGMARVPPANGGNYLGPVSPTVDVPGLPLKVPFDFRLSQVGADLLFYQAKHDRQQFSTKPLPGYQYRRKPLPNMSNSQEKWTKTHKVDTDSSGFFCGSGYYRKDEDPKKPRMGSMLLDPDGFQRAIEILADKVYRKNNQDPSESVAMFAEEVLSDLIRHVGASDLPRPKNISTQGDLRAADWVDSHEDSEAVNGVFHTARLALERIYFTYASNANPGWTLQTYTDFAEDFGVLRDLKMLTIHRIFYALADEPENKPPKIYMKFEAFARSLVYLAQWAVEGDYRVAHKLLLLFHRMNATPGAVRLTNNCDLFPVIKEIRDKIDTIKPDEQEVDATPTWSSLTKEGNRPGLTKKTN